MTAELDMAVKTVVRQCMGIAPGEEVLVVCNPVTEEIGALMRIEAQGEGAASRLPAVFLSNLPRAVMKRARCGGWDRCAIGRAGSRGRSTRPRMCPRGRIDASAHIRPAAGRQVAGRFRCDRSMMGRWSRDRLRP